MNSSVFQRAVIAQLDGAVTLVCHSVGLPLWQHGCSNITGRVIAVFERCAYIENDAGIWCLGLNSIGDGPFNVLLSNHYNALPKTIHIDCHVQLIQVPSTRGVIVVDCTVSRYPEWACQALPNCGSLPRPDHGLGYLLTAESANNLAQCIKQGASASDTALDERAQLAAFRQHVTPTLLALSHWLVVVLNHDRPQTSAPVPDLTALLGAGPGLTPSGDDFLGGVLLALHTIDRSDIVSVLWQSIQPNMASTTNDMSAAWLQQAAQANCGTVFLQLQALYFKQKKHFSLHAPSLLRQMGASSGWDTLAGFHTLMLIAQEQLLTPMYSEDATLSRTYH